MSILSRIARIVRAKLSFGESDDFDLSGKSRQYRQRRSTRSNKQTNGARERQNPSPQTGQDSELAKCYANLEVAYGADLETVTRAWKGLLRKYHPDMHSNDPEKLKIANQIVQELNRSYQILKEKLEK